jgi:lipopolysaccharide export system permease protein
VIVPVAVFGVAVSAAGIWFNDTLVPAATRGRQAIISDVQSRAGTSGRGIGAGFTYPIRQDGILTMLVHVEGGLDPASGELRDLSIETWDRGRVVAIVSAGRARWNGVGTRNWTLSGGVWSAFRGEDGQTLRITGAGAQTREVALGTPEELASLQRPVAEVSNRTLRERGRLLRTNGDLGGAREAEVEVARRVAIPFASFVFALVGAPLGVRPQRAGKGVGFGQSILITFLYWIALQFFTILGRSGALPPVVAVALPNLVGLLTAAYLIRRVMR